jgi:hypothetical protein
MLPRAVSGKIRSEALETAHETSYPFCGDVAYPKSIVGIDWFDGNSYTDAERVPESSAADTLLQFC